MGSHEDNRFSQRPFENGVAFTRMKRLSSWVPCDRRAFDHVSRPDAALSVAVGIKEA
jgi:hypothetical protein